VPTVLRAGSWVVRIYAPPREHPPPHVHVIHVGAGQVIIDLGGVDTPPTIRAIHRMRSQEALEAYRLVERHQPQLLSAWEALHGKVD